MTTQIGITGAAGRMGRILVEAIELADDSLQLSAAIERPDSTLLGADALRLVICHTTCSAAWADRQRHASRSSGAMLCSCRRCQNGLNGRRLVLMSTQPVTS